MKSTISQNLIIVPENIVMDAWNAVDNEEDSGFKKVLDASAAYKDAGMTPIFIFDTKNGDIYCCAKETFGKKLH
jgi:hypothetical protein